MPQVTAIVGVASLVDATAPDGAQPPSAPGPPLAAYVRADLRLRLRQSRIACVLTLVLVPAGAALDWFSHPDLLAALFTIRLACEVAVAGLLALHFTAIGRHHLRLLGAAWTLVTAAALGGMIHLTHGADSSYFPGLLLMITGICIIFPWTAGEAAAACAAILATFLAACLTRPDTLAFHRLFSSTFFIVLTSVICVTGCWYTSRWRLAEFTLRSQLDTRNRQLNESFAKLAELDRLRGQFFANVSHELRTPLTLIVAPLEDALRGSHALPDRIAEPLAVARQNALRLLKLINDLLEVVRLDEPGPGLRRERLDAGAFAAGVAESIRYLIEAKGLRLDCTGGRDPLPIAGDPARLEKVLLNLLTNAVKFTPAGGAIELRWRREGEQAVIEVADTGVGIPAESLPHIFDRFHQVDGSSTRRYQGIGIGLALARGLVIEHGGTLTARSTVGTGTCLRVALPLATTVAESPVVPTTPAVAADDADVIAAIYRNAERRGAITLDEGVSVEGLDAVGAGAALVLVVDDEPDMRRYLVARLAANWRVMQSDHGERALELTRRERPDLVLLDLMLPGIDGLAVCRAIRADAALNDTRIILLTARVDEAAKIAALDSGADDFLTKPFSSVEVCSRIASQLRTVDLQRAVRARNAELERTLARLRDTQSQLVHSEKMNALGVLTAGLLHEINNPLNFTLSALHVAHRLAPSASGLGEVLDDIGQGMGRIRDLVNDLALFAHKPSGDRRERVELATALTPALRLTAHELAGIIVDSDLPATAAVTGSCVRLSQVFMNLLINSARALRTVPDRAGRITVAATVANGRVRVSVHDNGPGIPPEVMPRIFEPFFTTREPGQGTGLGLSICHAIIADLGGTISVHSEAGRWTELAFELPLAATAEKESA